MFVYDLVLFRCLWFLKLSLYAIAIESCAAALVSVDPGIVTGLSQASRSLGYFVIFNLEYVRYVDRTWSI
jgi:hypothetical protein